MSKCPKCEVDISFSEKGKHSLWNPIVCENCHARLHFNKKDWYKNHAFYLISIVGLIFSLLVSGRFQAVAICLFAIMLVISSIRVFQYEKSARLEAREK